MTASSARKYLLGYLIVVFVLSWTWEAVLIVNGGLGAFGMAGPFLLMWIPGIVAIAMKLKLRGRLDALGWKPRHPRLCWVAYLLPPGVGLLAYGVAWSVGWAPLEVPWDRIAEKIAPGTLGLVLTISINSTLGIAIGSVYALGEEIGWRGFMVPLLLRANIPRPLLLSGFIWAIWHVPLILFADYATSSIPALSAILFVVMVTVDGVTFGWIRLASLSMWPAVLMHASHNSFFQGVFGKLTGESALAPFVVGESGVLPAVLYACVALWLWRTGRVQKSVESFLASSRVEEVPSSISHGA